MRDPFDACWYRWERANQHRGELGEVWNEYIDTHPYDTALTHQGGGVHVLRVWATDPMPAEFEVVFGEWLYNLRAALDYVIWATAAYAAGQVPPPYVGALQFPIYDSKSAWDSNRYRIKQLADHHIEMLHILQPFNSNPDANYLGWINRLARIDRHRSLINGTAYLAELKPVIAVEPHWRTTLEWGERVLHDDGADVARITVKPWEEGTNLQINPRFGIDPEVREWSSSPFWSRIRFSERLEMMQVAVASAIAPFEYDCRGHSRKANLLSDEYRADCDERQKIATLRRAPRPPVVWGAPEQGNPTDRRTFEGHGYPSGPAAVPRRTSLGHAAADALVGDAGPRSEDDADG